jgi:hypothetical protein
MCFQLTAKMTTKNMHLDRVGSPSRKAANLHFQTSSIGTVPGQFHTTGQGERQLADLVVSQL